MNPGRTLTNAESYLRRMDPVVRAGILASVQRNPHPPVLNSHGCTPGKRCRCPRSFVDCSGWVVLVMIGASLVRCGGL